MLPLSYSSGLYLEQVYGLLGPHLPPLLPPLLPPHHGHHLCCRSRTLQVCIKNIYTVYSGPTFLLSYLLSSLPITAITTCADALILFRSVFRTYSIYDLLEPHLPPLLPPLLPPHYSTHHLCCRSHTLQVCIRSTWAPPSFSPPSPSQRSPLVLLLSYSSGPYKVYSGPTFLLSSLPITALTTYAAALILFRSI